MDNEVQIIYLPDELLDLILEHKDIEIVDLMHLASTCTRLYDYVKSREILWKNKLRNILSTEEFDVIQLNHNGSWYTETKTYCQFRSDILSELRKMSPKLFRPTCTATNVRWEHVTRFFEIAKQKGTYLYLMIKFLHFVVKNCDGKATTTVRKPFTLTDAFYARIIPRFLIQSVLLVKWVHTLLTNNSNSQVVIQFFVQWMGTDNLYSEEEVELELNKLTETVESLLDSNHPLKSTSAEERKTWVFQIEENMFDPYSCIKILEAIAKVLFKINPIVLASDADLDSLNFIQVIKTRRSFITTLASLYETVARRCGVKCELIVFPDHLFLEWKESHKQGSLRPTFTINLNTGELERQRQCPFSQRASQSANRMVFNPNLLLQHLLHFYELTGNWRNRHWITDNLFGLSLFLSHEHGVNHYRDFMNVLTQLMQRNSATDKQIDIKNIDDVFLEYIWVIANLNKHTEKRTDNKEKVTVNRHNSGVKYAVGMICEHVLYEYTCVIRGWTEAPQPYNQSRNSANSQELPGPAYTIIASDNSERTVLQDQLRPARRPQRLPQLEESLGREFALFDGFAYVPNAELHAYYPDDGPIRDMYKTQAHYCD